jgi:hypothetical protein
VSQTALPSPGPSAGLGAWNSKCGVWIGRVEGRSAVEPAACFRTGYTWCSRWSRKKGRLTWGVQVGRCITEGLRHGPAERKHVLSVLDVSGLQWSFITSGSPKGTRLRNGSYGPKRSARGFILNAVLNRIANQKKIESAWQKERRGWRKARAASGFSSVAALPSYQFQPQVQVTRLLRRPCGRISVNFF